MYHTNYKLENKLINILIVGAGAIGCLVGGQLAVRGHKVTLLGRPKLIKAVTDNGLHLQWPDGKTHIVHPTVIKTLSEHPNLAEVDLIFITVKSFDTATAVTGLANALAPTARIISLQNGVGNEEILSEHLPNQPLVAGSITLPVSVPSVGTIQISKDKGSIALAAVLPQTNITDIKLALEQAHFRVSCYTDYQSLKWSKLLMNIMSNAASAILDLPPKEVLQYDNLFNLELEAMRETLAVMRAMKIKVVSLPSYPLTALAIGLRWLPNPILRSILRPIMAGGRGNKLPSLLLDLRQGRNQSEVDVLNKAVVIAGKSLGIKTPVNKGFWSILSEIVQGAVPWSEYQGQTEKLYQKIVDSG